MPDAACSVAHNKPAKRAFVPRCVAQSFWWLLIETEQNTASLELSMRLDISVFRNVCEEFKRHL